MFWSFPKTLGDRNREQKLKTENKTDKTTKVLNNATKSGWPWASAHPEVGGCQPQVLKKRKGLNPPNAPNCLSWNFRSNWPTWSKVRRPFFTKTNQVINKIRISISLNYSQQPIWNNLLAGALAKTSSKRANQVSFVCGKKNQKNF